MNRFCKALPLLTLVAAPMSVAAAQTTTYTYDALGRLTQSTIAGGQQNGTATTIQYDPAGNRVNYQVAGVPAAQQAPSPSSTPAQVSTPVFIVVPLNGFTLIPTQ